MGVQVGWGTAIVGAGPQNFLISLDAPNSRIIATSCLSMVWNHTDSIPVSAATYIPSYTVAGSNDQVVNPGNLPGVLAADNVTSVTFSVLASGASGGQATAVFTIITV